MTASCSWVECTGQVNGHSAKATDFQMRIRKSRIRKRNPLTLKSLLEKAGDRFWKFKEVRHRSLKVRGFHDESCALRPYRFSEFTTGQSWAICHLTPGHWWGLRSFDFRQECLVSRAPFELTLVWEAPFWHTGQLRRALLKTLIQHSRHCVSREAREMALLAVSDVFV